MLKIDQPKKIRIYSKHLLASSVLLTSLLLGACSTIDPYTRETKTSNAAKGAGIGALSGAVIGVLAGDSSKAALIGAGVGALAGGGVGHYMDVQEAKLRQDLEATGVSVMRQGDSIILVMPGNITFNTASSNISANFYSVLSSVAMVINKYEKTYVDIYGYTDSVGQAGDNLILSQQRADSVSQYLQTRQVLRQRISTRGEGESNPVASNDTPQGRAQNRRVEIRLTPLT